MPEYCEQEGEEVYAIFHVGINQTISENHKMFFKHMPLKAGRLLDVGCRDGVFLVGQKENLKFDIITFFEVLEHQDKPREFLEAVKSMLKPGGRIARSVPNRESIWIRLYNKFNKNSDYPPNHLIRFNNYSLIFHLNNTLYQEKYIFVILIYRAEGDHSINADIKASNTHLRKIFKMVLKPILNLIEIIMVFVYGNNSTIYFQYKIVSEGVVK